MRTRYIQIGLELVEAKEFVEDKPDKARYHIMGCGDYEGLRATDGTDISTRTKHREYMKAKGLTTIDDFKETWAQAAQKRADLFQGKDPTRLRDVERAFHTHVKD